MMEWVFGVSGNPNCMKTVIGFFFLDQLIILVMHCDVIFGKLQKSIKKVKLNLKSLLQFAIQQVLLWLLGSIVASWVCCCMLGLLLLLGLKP